MLPRVRPLTLAGLCLVSLGACIDTNPNVFVAPSIDLPTLFVNGTALGTTVTGTFSLSLDLGARASGPSSVTLGSFSIQSADGETTLVEVLPITFDPASPVDVAEGTEVTVDAAIDSGTKPLDAGIYDALCGQSIIITGVIEDSLEVGSTPVSSDPFTAMCSR